MSIFDRLSTKSAGRPARRSFSRWYLDLLLSHRAATVAVVTLLTLFLGYYLLQIRVYTDFFELYPPNHPYIKLYKEYRKMFGSANVLVVVVHVKKGDIYTVKTVGTIDKITRTVEATRGVDPLEVISLTHPRLKNIQVTGKGIEIRPVVFPSLPRDARDLARLKRIVYENAGIRGFYVSPDDKSAAIFAGFWENADLGSLYSRMEALKKTYSDANTVVYVTGYPMLFAWIAHYLPLTIVVLVITGAAIALLLWFYFRTWTGVWVPLLSGGLSALWALGFAGLVGFNLDPLGLVVFVLITARALSHSVQSIERYHTEYHARKDKLAAIVASYRALFPPAMVSISADGLAILTLATVSIPLIQHIAYISSFWVISIAVSVVTLHPVLLSCLPEPKEDPKAGKRLSDKVYNGISRGCVRLAMGGAPYAVVSVFVVLMGVGVYFSHQLKVGDVSIGKALLRDNHPYNRAFEFLNKNFVGSAQLVVVAQGDKPGAIKNRKAVVALEEFEDYMKRGPNTGGAVTIADLVRTSYRTFHEGEPRWAFVPYQPRSLGNIMFLIAASSAPGDMDRYYSPNMKNATVTVYYRRYSNAIIKSAIARAQRFIDAVHVPHVKFRLAGGLMGILAATNDAVEHSYRINLYLVLATVFALSFLTYRSVLGALIVMLPSLLAQPLSEAIMLLSHIDLNINSLPVAAVGIGIGIDYGYYVLSRIIEELKRTQDFDEANRAALMTTGRAILFTGTTLTVSVIFWMFFPMKFQADMAFVLAVLLALHVLGALVFIPAAVKLIKPHFVSALAMVPDEQEEEQEAIELAKEVR